MENDNQIMVLNDLIRINNDRIEGYRKASENFKDDHMELLSLFSGCIIESQDNNVTLSHQVRRLGGTPDNGTTMGGKIYRAWMDFKATFGGDNAKGILESCERGEDAAKKAYQTAVESGDLDSESLSVVTHQRERQLQSHDKVKELRDRFKK